MFNSRLSVRPVIWSTLYFLLSEESPWTTLELLSKSHQIVSTGLTCSTALGACICCIIGSVVAACVRSYSISSSPTDIQSANTSQHSLLIIGRILLGFGSIVIEISQNKLYAHWFAGSTLSFVVALDLAWNSLTSIIARLSAVPMSRLNGWYGWALWIPSFVIMACTVLVIAYIFFERRVPEVYRPKKGSQSTQLKGLGRWKFALVSITQLYVNLSPISPSNETDQCSSGSSVVPVSLLCRLQMIRLMGRNIPERRKDSLQRQPSRHSRKDKRNFNPSGRIQFVPPKCCDCFHGPPHWFIL